MAFNPSPEVAVARDAAKKLDATMCIVLYVTKDNKLGMASYGQNKNLCEYAGLLGDAAYETLMEGIASGWTNREKQA